VNDISHAHRTGEADDGLKRRSAADVLAHGFSQGFVTCDWWELTSERPVGKKTDH
jgi:hypothetical protein